MDHHRTGEGWRRADEIFAAALDLPPPRRDAYLEEACAGHPGLETTVRELLGAAGEADRLLDRSREALARAAAGAFGEEEPEPPEGRRIGPWRLVREIGRGGMGAVYLAERADGEFEQRVALKILRRGPTEKARLDRFLEERQILASLEHPNIARLLDGGTTDSGRPYLVMEHVEGRSVTAHCEEHGLDVEERLEVFCSVAETVRHAHRNLVVHRDLKPSNVLVTDDGRVKLLDFGIAELQAERGGSRGAVGAAGDGGETVEGPGDGPGGDGRAAPGEGRVPGDGGRASASAGGDGGGPAAVRALTPEYASPEQLAGEPVTTASDVYQLGALLYELLSGRRPRAPSVGAAAAARTLRGGPPAPPDEAGEREVHADLEAIVLKALRREPEERYGSVGQMVEDVRRHLERRPVAARDGGWRYRAGRFVSRNRWAVAAAALLGLLAGSYAVTVTAYADRLERERDVARRESEKAAQVQAFLVDLFRRPDPFARDEDFRGSDLTVREALELGLERARTELSSRPDVQADLLRTIAGVYANLDLEERALEVQREALRTARRVRGEEAPGTLEDLDLLATRLWQLGRYAEADSLYRREYLPLARRVHGPAGVEVARGLMGLGNVLSARSELEEAEVVLDSAARLFRAAGPGRRQLRAEVLHNLANLRNRLDLPGEAEDAARRAVALREEAYGADHPHTAVALTALATALAHQGRHGEAEALDRRALSILEDRLGPDHDYTLSTLNNLAVRAADRGDFAEAARHQRRLLRIHTEKSGGASEEAAGSLQNLAAILNRAGRREEAADRAREAHQIFREVLGPGHVRTALPLLTLSEIHLAAGDWPEAARAAAGALEILSEALPEGHRVTAVARGRLGRARAGQGRLDRAEELLLSSLEALRASPAGTARHRAEMLSALVELYERWERPEEARVHRSRLSALEE